MSAWLTLGDVRLAGLRVAVAVAVPVLVGAALGAEPRVVIATLSFVLWTIGPAALAERHARRRGAGLVGTALQAAVVGALLTPVGVVQAVWSNAAYDGGLTAALAAAEQLPAAPWPWLALLGAVAFGSAAAFPPLVERGPPEDTPLALVPWWLCGLVILGLGMPLLALYALADLIDLWLGASETPAEEAR